MTHLLDHRPALRPAAAVALGPVLAATALATLFVVLLDQGNALAAVGAALDSATTHELFHDSRHLVGAPCH